MSSYIAVGGPEENQWFPGRNQFLIERLSGEHCVTCHVSRVTVIYGYAGYYLLQLFLYLFPISVQALSPGHSNHDEVDDDNDIDNDNDNDAYDDDDNDVCHY